MTPSDPAVRALRRVTILALLASAAALALAVIALRPRDELTVSRVNIVEPDGTPRMILASRARFPGAFDRKKEIARPDRRDLAGVLFLNDEGTENGGLVQRGALDAGGKVNAGLSLTFDRFREDQMLQLLLDEQGDATRVGVQVNDQPSYQAAPLFDIQAEIDALPAAARDAAIKRHDELGHFGHRRGYFGTRKGHAMLELDDPQGRPRLVMRVSETGEPTIEWLDDQGHATRTLSARDALVPSQARDAVAP